MCNKVLLKSRLYHVDKRDKARFIRLLYVVALALAAFLIYLPSELGAALTIPPDSSEYSICLANLFEYGRFGFTLNGEWHPSRYAPWFSLLCLTPAYLLSGGNVLCMHWAVLAFALVLLVAVWKMGVVCGLGKLSIIPPILLMFMPDFIFYSRVAMTEIPYATLTAILALMFVRFANQPHLSTRLCVGIGLLVAWAGMVRSTGFTLAVPFVVVIFAKRMEWKRKLTQASVLAVPMVAVLSVELAYNWIAFGSPLRSGYNYWQSVPIDFPSLTFNLENICHAVEHLLTQPIIWLTLASMGMSLLYTIYVVKAKAILEHKEFLSLEGFVLFHALILVSLYLAYYWIDTRFFLPIVICSMPLSLVAVNNVLSRAGFRLKSLGITVVFLLCLIAIVNAHNRYLYIVLGRQVWLSEAQVSGSVLPSGSVVIQRGDPNVVEYFGFKDKELILFPVSREGFDYTSDMVAPKRISDCCPKPHSCWQKIIPKLIAAGVCRLPFPDVFKDNPNQVQKYLSAGKRVFILQDRFSQKEFESIRSRLDGMGLTLKEFGVWNVPEIPSHPIRHLYDKLLFPGYSMDSRPEITVAYYEVVVAEGCGKSTLEPSDAKKGYE